ncbi:hypothetical protein EBH_0083310 [Eimeria brunetti]|uniref:Uncharacterized protein n=1 Tax=Eimeria brunetti TaxID=51314 RepID=U6LY20_9EIME|nr:hypothetical protein EBH_0083310 [Eimeria brunetti]
MFEEEAIGQTSFTTPARWLSGSAITRCRRQQVCGYYDTPVADAQWSLEVEQFEEPLKPGRQTQFPGAGMCLAAHIRGVRLQSGSVTRVGKVESYGVSMRACRCVELQLRLVSMRCLELRSRAVIVSKYADTTTSQLSGAAITRCYRQQVCGYYDTPVPDAQWSLEVEQFAGPLEPAKQTQFSAPSRARKRRPGTFWECPTGGYSGIIWSILCVYVDAACLDGLSGAATMHDGVAEKV